jgi:DNA-binding CsgD family transcriptional regulator
VSQLGQFSEFLLALYRAAREVPLPQFQDEALELLKPALRFDSAQWGGGSINPEWISKRHVHLHNDRPDAALIYDDVKDQDDPVKLAWRREHGAIAYNIADFMPGRSRAGIRAYAKKVEHANVLMRFDIDTSNAVAQWLSLYRQKDTERFGASDPELISLLTPHLWEALTINRITHLEHLGGGEGERRFDLAICDFEGRWLHVEEGFRQLVGAEFGHAGTVRLPQDCLAHLLRDDKYVGHVSVLTTAQRADVLFLKARRVAAADGLTAREDEVARLVAQGKTHKQVAGQLRISVSTVSNHMRAIHDKLEIRNAAELAAELRRV